MTEATLRLATAKCSLGALGVVVSERGLCALELAGAPSEAAATRAVTAAVSQW